MREFITILEGQTYTRFSGMGGLCGQAAVAINRVVFNNKGKLVGAFNRAFYDVGRLTGHVAVLVDGTFWDADAKPKTEDEIESWGMLDGEDPDYREFADEYSIDWNETTQQDVIWVEMSEKEVLDAFGRDHLANMMAHLGAKPTDVLAEGSKPWGKFWYHADSGEIVEVAEDKEHADYFDRGEIPDRIADGWVRLGYSSTHGELWMECYGADEARDATRWAMSIMGMPHRLMVSTQNDDLTFEGPIEIRRFLRRKGNQ